MMSRTDKTQPYPVAVKDPLNRRFMIVRSDGKWGPWFWKKLTSCHNSNCCTGYWKKDERRKARTAERKELTRLRQTPMVDWNK